MRYAMGRVGLENKGDGMEGVSEVTGEVQNGKRRGEQGEWQMKEEAVMREQKECMLQNKTTINIQQTEAEKNISTHH